MMRLGRFVRKRKINGEKIYQFENQKLMIIIEKFHKAGKFYWPEKTQQLGREGIGFNKKVFRKLEDLLIYIREENEFFKLAKKPEDVGKDREKQTTLIVVPFSCFEKVNLDDVENVRDKEVPIRLEDAQVV